MATLRAAELEVLFTADTKQVEKADKDVKSIGERIEKKPIKQKIDVDSKQALDGMARVEKAAMTIDGALDEAKAAGATFSRSLVQGFLESDRVGKKTAAEIESVLVKSYNVPAAAARKFALISTGELGKVEAAAKRVASTDAIVEDKVETAGALAGMDRVEQAAKKLVSQDTALKLDADVTRAEKSLDRAKQRLADLEVRALGGLDVTADVRRAEAALSKIERNLAGLQTARTQIEIDPSPALASMDRVEDAVRRIVSQDTALKLDADIAGAEKEFEKAKQHLTDLELRALGGLDVTADVTRAEASLQRVERDLKGLQSARTMIDVDASTIKAEKELEQVVDKAADAGERSGQSFASGLDAATRGAGAKVGDVVGGDIEGTLIAALAAIPIAGGIVLAGVAIGKAISGAIQDGLQVEVGNDRLQALTGIDEADALRLGRVAGEAYANVFGDSVEANMDTTRLALQFDLIDADTSSKSAQKVVEGLSGIADVLGEDVRPIAAAVTTMLTSGLAESAENAFDILATGAREGVNRSEDLIDTFTEYPATFSRLGLSAEEALGLLNQGLGAGARNSDLAADALKEFQIRATDGSKASAEGFEALGLNAEEMTAKISRGGQEAHDGLELVLAKLRATEDPVLRNAAAVALFGTQAEDLGTALFAMDLSTAVAQLDGVAGSAQTMFATLADNDATKMEQASRNIEVATDGIKGALAAAFSEPLANLADFVSQNRGPVMQFMLDLANGALDFGVSMVESTADGAEALGEFIAGPGAGMVDMLIGIQKSINPFADTSALEGMRDEMKGFDDVTAGVANTMRTKLIDEGIEPARARLNEFGDGAVAMGFLNDASLRLAGTLGEVGVGADGALLSLDGIDLANIRASDSGRALSDQVQAGVIALQDEQVAASAAGESQEALAERYGLGTAALVGQLTQMGLTEEQAQALINTVLQTPTSATTAFGSNAPGEQGKVQNLADRITTLPDGSVVIRADTVDATAKIAAFKAALAMPSVVITPELRASNPYYLNRAEGGVVEFMAQGGLRGLTPMSHTAQVVPPSTWRVVGDRGDVPESFIPLDGSARSMSILLETMRRMGVMPMAAGGITASKPGMRGPDRPAVVTVEVATVQNEDPRVLGRIIGRELTNALAGMAS